MKIYKIIIGKVKSLISKNKYLHSIFNRNYLFQEILIKKRMQIKLPTIEYMDIVGDSNIKIESYTFLEGNSMLTDIGLIKSIVKKFPKCVYLEIGCWRGETLINIAKVAKKCYSLSFSEEEMKIFGWSKEIISQNHLFTRNLENLTIIGHNSLTYDFSKLEEKFDVIFIDAEHSYEAVLSDTKNALKKLRDEKSIIIWHDYGLTPEKVNNEVLAAILDGIPISEHKYLFHVSNTVCAIYIKDMTLKSYFVDFPAFPNKKFNISIEIEKI